MIQVVFKPNYDRRIFLFLGEVGVIEGTFGTSGKFRVSIPGITFHPGSHGLRLSWSFTNISHCAIHKVGKSERLGRTVMSGCGA